MAARKLPLLIFFLPTLYLSCGYVTQDLGGKWTINNANKSLFLTGKVPGCVHTALMENGTIGNVYYRFNDVMSRWIDLDNWTYARSFEGKALLFTSTSYLSM